MKKLIIGTLLILAATAFAGYVNKGFGRVAKATPTPTQLLVKDTPANYANVCSVTVTGPETVYFLKNCSTAQFVRTNAIPIPSGTAYTFKTQSKIYNICYATESGSSEVLFAFE